MPWKLIIFILIFAILLTFIMFNLGEHNRCDISFGFKTVPQVPVFLTIFVSFFLGLLSALPLIFLKKKQSEKPIKPLKTAKSKTETEKSEESAPAIAPDEKIKQEAAAAKERFLARRRGK